MIQTLVIVAVASVSACVLWAFCFFTVLKIRNRCFKRREYTEKNIYNLFGQQRFS